MPYKTTRNKIPLYLPDYARGKFSVSLIPNMWYDDEEELCHKLVNKVRGMVSIEHLPDKAKDATLVAHPCIVEQLSHLRKIYSVTIIPKSKPRKPSKRHCNYTIKHGRTDKTLQLPSIELIFDHEKEIIEFCTKAKIATYNYNPLNALKSADERTKRNYHLALSSRKTPLKKKIVGIIFTKWHVYKSRNVLDRSDLQDVLGDVGGLYKFHQNLSDKFLGDVDCMVIPHFNTHYDHSTRTTYKFPWSYKRYWTVLSSNTSITENINRKEWDHSKLAYHGFTAPTVDQLMDFGDFKSFCDNYEHIGPNNTEWDVCIGIPVMIDTENPEGYNSILNYLRLVGKEPHAIWYMPQSIPIDHPLRDLDIH